MKVLGILGSPRRGGNTEVLLDRALAGAESMGAETEKVVLNELNITPCQNCDDCLAAGECSVQDDMQGLYPKLRQADRIIIASPVFFLNLSAQTKAMIDRCQSLWVTKYVLHQPVGSEGRKGLLISVGHWQGRGNFQCSITTVKAFFATLDVSYERELLVGGVERKGDILSHPTARDDAFAAGARLASPTEQGEL